MMFPVRVVLALSLLLAMAFLHSNRANASGPIVDLPFRQEYRDPFIHTEPPMVKDKEGNEKPGPNSKENDARAVAVDGKGRVWAGTADGLRQIVEGKFVQPEGQKIGGPVYRLAVGADGVVWVGAWNGVYRVVDGRVEHEAGGPAGPITAVLATKDRIVTANDKGLDERVGGKWRPLPGPWATTILDLAIADGDLYVAAWSGLYRKSGDVVTRIAKPSEILSRNLRALAVGPDGRLWAGSRGGIDVYRAGRREKSFSGDALPSSDILSLSFDREGRLWVGTTLGASRYDGKSWSLRHSRRWVPNDVVRDVAFAEDGTAWIATRDGASAIRRREMTLAAKADYFQKEIRDRHVRPPGLVERCGLSKPGDLKAFEPRDTDNDGLFTGLYVAAESYRYAVTGAADAKANAAEGYAAMEFLQTVTGTNGFVARTVIPSDWKTMSDVNRVYTPQEEADERAEEARFKKVENHWRKSADGKWLWKGDTSSDEVTGHFYAYGMYYDLVADEKEKQRVANHVRKIMDYIIAGGLVLRDIDGEATRWAVWSPEKLNDDPNWWLERGINSVEILSYLTVARHVTGDAKYDREIEKLLNEHGYAKNILVSMQPEPDYFTHIGFQLLSLVYPGLMTYEKDAERRTLYLQSMESWFRPVRNDASPLYGYVYAAFKGGDYRPEECAAILRDVPLDMIDWSITNSTRQDVTLVEKPVEGEVQTDRLLPPSERAVFKWDSNVHQANGGSNGNDEATSVAWLLPYWLGRHYGLIAAP